MLLSMLLIVAGCGAEQKADSPPPAEAPAAGRRPLQRQGRPVEVAVHLPKIEGRYRWEAETAGLVTAVLEHSLAELIEVSPAVDGVRPSPSMPSGVGADGERWSATLRLGSDPDDLEIALDVCDGGGACTAITARGSRVAPWAAIGEIVKATGATLGRNTTEEAEAAWSRAESDDDYAVLLAGRAAATFYGFLPAVPPDQRGDRKKDAMERAVLVDPGMARAWWVLGRRRLADGDSAGARAAFARAGVARPESAVFIADQAAVSVGDGKTAVALSLWEEVHQRLPDDPRFVASRARLLLGQGRIEEVRNALSSLPRDLQEQPDVIALHVALRRVERKTRDAEFLDLLARWQAAAPRDPEPVRQRIAWLSDAGRPSDASALVDELAGRGAAAEAAHLMLALAMASGDLAAAASAAEALSDPATAGRIRARMALDADPATVPPELVAAHDGVALVARGEARLLGGRAADALADADAALLALPWMPEALVLRAAALDALARAAEAADARAQLAWAEPAGAQRGSGSSGGRPAAGASGGPITAPGSIGAGSQEQSSTP
jgi:hypothetical protein